MLLAPVSAPGGKPGKATEHKVCRGERMRIDYRKILKIFVKFFHIFIKIFLKAFKIFN